MVSGFSRTGLQCLPMLRLLAVIASWLLSTALLAPLCFFAGIFLVGPHAGLLPGMLEAPILILCSAVLLVVPIWLASKVRRRMGTK
jgi:hypothetical protein